MNKYVLKLYIAGRSLKSDLAIKNLRSMCHKQLHHLYDFVVIDVLESPELAEKERILATPTLIKESPLPARRVIGDLSDIDKVLFGLELTDIQTEEE